jgi:hypothetical protein
LTAGAFAFGFEACELRPLSDCFLRHNYFEAYVDHSALKWLLTMKEPVGKFARWIAVIRTLQNSYVLENSQNA